MQRWSFSGVPKLLGKCQSRSAFQQENMGQSSHKKLKKTAYLNQLNVRNPLVLLISQKREDLRLFSLVQNGKSRPRPEVGIFECTS
jgi:hypothetical protein